MHIADALQQAGLNPFPCRLDKTPAIHKGENWKALEPGPRHWPSPLAGVPVPAGILVIDLDLYKGVTREAVDHLLGCVLPWDTALIQKTQSGGEHYAFRCEYQARNGSNLHGLRGFDTRSAGKGYICTGEPYYTGVGFGVFSMVQPGILPCIPDETMTLLEHAGATPTPAAPTGDTPDAKTVLAALGHIDPGCDRAKWVKVGMALKSWGDPEGFDVWAHWSSGGLDGHEMPSNYVAEHLSHQWESFKAEGDTTLGSLFYEAIQGGWVPPSRLDIAQAFGAGSVDADAFNGIVDRIVSHGGDPKYTESLISDIRGVGGNALQVATLLAVLTHQLKEAGLLTGPIRKALDGIASPRTPGMYGKNHTENAAMYLERCYPSGGIVRADQTWYTYDGKSWVERSDDDVIHAVGMELMPAKPMHSTITGTCSVLGAMCHSAGQRINEIDPALILFQNGVLDLRTAVLLPHDPGYFTTTILPYDFIPGALAPNWIAFLNDVFQGDAERIALLQEWFGYMMSNSYLYHKILFLLGPPRSGKGTIGRILEAVVGTANFTGLSLHSLTSDPFLASLRTKSVAFSGDTERRVNRHSVDTVIERLKKISGNDAVTFARKWKTTLSQTLPTRITLAGNHVPNLFDDSGALASRMLVLPFDVSYLDRENAQLLDQLTPELAGIAAWSLNGLARLSQRNAFTVPEASKAEMQFIAETYSPLKMFIDEGCIFDADAITGCNEIHDAYHAWAVRNKESHILPRKAFVSAFKDATRGQARYGVHRESGVVFRGFRGVGLHEYEPLGLAGAVR